MRNLEQKAIEILNLAITKWAPKFIEHSSTFGIVELHRKGEGDNYFSEIESFIWQKNNVFDVLNLILFLNGTQLISIDELPLFINNAIEHIFNKFK
jgi:hypothetical protein